MGYIYIYIIHIQIFNTYQGLKWDPVSWSCLDLHEPKDEQHLASALSSYSVPTVSTHVRLNAKSSNAALSLSLTLRVQSTQTQGIYGFCVMNRSIDKGWGCRLRYRLHIWVLGPLLGCSADFVSPLSIPCSPCTKPHQSSLVGLLTKPPKHPSGSRVPQMSGSQCYCMDSRAILIQGGHGIL